MEVEEEKKIEKVEKQYDREGIVININIIINIIIIIKLIIIIFQIKIIKIFILLTCTLSVHTLQTVAF